MDIHYAVLDNLVVYLKYDMATTAPETDQLIQKMILASLGGIVQWKITSDCIEGPTVTNNLLQVSVETLARVHPKLPTTLRAFDAWRKRASRNHNTGFDLFAQTEYLTQVPQLIPDTSGVTWEAFGITNIGSIYGQQDATLTICKATTAITPEYPDTPCVTIFEPWPILVSTQWLEQQYLGWETRYTAAQSLGYTDRDLVEQVFAPTVIVPEVTLPGLDVE